MESEGYYTDKEQMNWSWNAHHYNADVRGCQAVSERWG